MLFKKYRTKLPGSSQKKESLLQYQNSSDSAAGSVSGSPSYTTVCSWSTRPSPPPTLKYIHQKLSTEFPYSTRLAQSEAVRMGSEFQCKLDLTEKSFMARATRAYNQIPTEIRRTPKVETFKLKLKDWVQKNCPIWDVSSQKNVYHLGGWNFVSCII